MGKRTAWIPRAVFGTMVLGLALLAYVIFAIWLYRQAADVAPDWLTARRPSRSSLLEIAGTVVSVLGAGVVGIGLGIPLFRLLGIPSDAFDPGGAVDDHPFNRRPQSERAKTQPGSEGYVDRKVDSLGGLAAALRGVKPAKWDDPEG